MFDKIVIASQIHLKKNVNNARALIRNYFIGNYVCIFVYIVRIYCFTFYRCGGYLFSTL
jgi:hypothetical protein